MAGKPISLDMSKAVSMAPLPTPGPYLCMVSKLESGKSAAGEDKVHAELKVVQPDTPGVVNRIFFDDINLVNEFTLGRLQNLLKALGVSEEDLKSTDFAFQPEDFIGEQVTVWAGLRESDEFGDRNTIRRVGPASAYAA